MFVTVDDRPTRRSLVTFHVRHTGVTHSDEKGNDLMNSTDLPNNQHDTETIHDLGELIAATPHLLGFHPVESLVVISLTTDTPATVNRILRVDLPKPSDRASVAAELTRVVARQSLTRVMLVVVGQASAAPRLPHRALVDQCSRRFTQAGITVVEQLWIGTTRDSGLWRCYAHRACGGVMPDPRATTLAATLVHAGIVTDARREDRVVTLAPAPTDVLTRRAALLANQPANTDPDQSRRDLALVITAIDRAAAGVLPESDQDFVDLARALANHCVRDAFVSVDDPNREQAATVLWQCLTRGTPPRQRAEPAVLCAFAAYSQGDGVLAGIALDEALAAYPLHRLANMLHSVLTAGVSPDHVRAFGAEAAARARANLGTT